MERVVRGRSFTLTKTFYEGGVATDPTGTPTVTITRDDGTTVTAGAVVNEAADGTFSVTVAASENTLLDILSVDWAATVNGESQEYLDTVEVVGGVLFTIAQARALKPMDSTSAYSTARIIEARTMVETALEDACGVAFVPRYGKRVVSGNGRSTIMLPPKLRSVRSVALEGVAATDVADIRVLPTGEAYYPAWWTAGYANFEIAYEHGYDSPPPRVSQAALLWAKKFLVSGPVDDRATSMSTEDGTFSLATPGVRGSFTGIPEVDAVIQQYSLTVAVA